MAYVANACNSKPLRPILHAPPLSSLTDLQAHPAPLRVQIGELHRGVVQLAHDQGEGLGARETLAAPGTRALATRDASLSLSLRPQFGRTPLHLMCFNENATPEMTGYVAGLWPDAIKEKDNVRARHSPRRERAPSRRVTPRSLSRFVRSLAARLCTSCASTRTRPPR